MRNSIEITVLERESSEAGEYTEERSKKQDRGLVKFVET